MNRKFSFLAVLTVIVAIFAVTSMVLADAPVVTRPDGSAAEVNQGEATALVVTAGETIQWYKADTSNGDGVAVVDDDEDDTTLNVDTSVVGTAFYYAEVDGVKSNAMKVTVFELRDDPIVYRFDSQEAINTYAADYNSTLSLAVDPETGKNTMKSLSTAADCGVTLKCNVDMLKYPYMVIKMKSYRTTSDRAHMFHIYECLDPANSVKGADANFAKTIYDVPAAPAEGEPSWGFAKTTLKPGSNGIKEDAITYLGGRFDFFNSNDAVPNQDYVLIDYFAFFTSEAQRDEFLLTEEVELPEVESKNWEFANDKAFAADFFVDDVTVTDDGVALVEDTEYATALMSRNKFDLATYSVIKVFYNGVSGVTKPKLTLSDGDNVLAEFPLPKGSDYVTIDLTDDDAWKGEFSELVISSTKNVNISAIAFFKSKRDAATYTAEAEFVECTCDENCACGGPENCVDGCTCIKDAGYEDAIWWDFTDTAHYNRIHIENATPEYIAAAPTAGTRAVVAYTAKEDGDVVLTYNSVNMKQAHKVDAAEYPFVVIGYNGNMASTDAYIEFTTDYSDVPVRLDFSLDDANIAVGADADGNNKLELDLSSLTAIKAINPNATEEFRGNLTSFVLGFVDAAAGDTIEMAYVVFFADRGQSQRYEGDVIVPPAASIVGSWKSKHVIKEEYITLDDLDMTAEKVEFSLEDYSRISRLTLNELKRDYPKTLITVNGTGYRYEFYPNNVKSELKTWYYDFDAHFEAGFSGDVYREAVKNLVTEEVGTYLGGIHFIQKFVKDTSFPFTGKFIFEVGTDLNDKYLDIYKYDPATNTIALAERAPVKDGMLTITTFGGDIAIVDSGYQPSEEELARAAAIETLENTVWDALIYDFNADADALMTFKVANANVTTKTENGVTFKSASSAKEGTRMEVVFQPNTTFETSEYPVMLVKYKTSSNLQGSVNNYISTEYYTSTAGGDNYNGYTWFKDASYYNATAIYAKSTKWTTKLINYTDMASMKASGLPVSAEHVDGGGAKIPSGAAYPFKGNMKFYRLDFNVGPVGTVVDFAYIAFFKTEEEAKKYMDARTAVDEFLDADAKAAEEAAKAALPDYFVFDFLDKNETIKYSLHGGNDTFPVKTETKNTAEGFWGKDSDGEFNYTRTLEEDEIFSLADYPVLKVKVKYSIGGTTTQFYVWQDNQSGNPRADIIIDKANEWTTQIWDFSKTPIASGNWNGNLTRFRIDPMRGAGSVEREATIEYIGFFKTVEAAEAFTSVADAKKAEKEAKK